MKPRYLALGVTLALIALICPVQAAVPNSGTLQCIAKVLSALPWTISVKTDVGGETIQFTEPAQWVKSFLVMEYAWRKTDGSSRTDKLYVTAADADGYELVGFLPHTNGRDQLDVDKILYGTCHVADNWGILPVP